MSKRLDESDPNELITCPSCGYKTITDEYDICPICGWEHDVWQLNHPDDDGGPNYVTLRDAQKNFREIGASSPKRVRYSRPPSRNDIRDQNWESFT